jgi:aminomethyltransferase
MEEKSVPREGYEILLEKGKDQFQSVGKITSGTFSPTFKKGIGMGLINSSQMPIKEDIEIGKIIYINIRNNNYKARIVKRPFYLFRGGK